MEALAAIGTYVASAYEGATAFEVASTAVSAATAVAGGVSASRANSYNAKVLSQRAELARSAYNQREEQQRRTNRFAEGKRLAAIAESGFGDTGSNLATERQSEVLQELDALNIRYQGQLEASGLDSQAELESYNARTNRQMAYISAGSRLLAGVAKYGGKRRLSGSINDAGGDDFS